MRMTRRKSLKFLAALGVAVATAFGTAGAGKAVAAPSMTVVATTSMVADAVRQVGGDRVAVTALMGPGVDPHAYRQTRSDIAAMLKADAVLWHGLYLEAQLEDFLLDLAERKPVFAVGEAVSRDRLIAHSDYGDRYDPHVWMDPMLWRSVVLAVRDALSEIDPNGSAAYAAGAERHLAEVEALAAYAKARLETVPAGRRVLVTAHDAFSYFGRAFDFEVMGIQGISTESEAGLRRIEELVAFLVERDISAVFVESSVSERNIRALIEGAAARGHTVSVGGELFSDAMGKSGSYEGTYIGMIDHNVTGITRALGGDAPAEGMRGRLGLGS